MLVVRVEGSGAWGEPPASYAWPHPFSSRQLWQGSQGGHVHPRVVEGAGTHSSLAPPVPVLDSGSPSQPGPRRSTFCAVVW